MDERIRKILTPLFIFMLGVLIKMGFISQYMPELYQFDNIGILVAAIGVGWYIVGKIKG